MGYVVCDFKSQTTVYTVMPFFHPNFQQWPVVVQMVIAGRLLSSKLITNTRRWNFNSSQGQWILPTSMISPPPTPTTTPLSKVLSNVNNNSACSSKLSRAFKYTKPPPTRTMTRMPDLKNVNARFQAMQLRSDGTKRTGSAGIARKQSLCTTAYGLSVVNISQLSVPNSFIALSGPGNTSPSSQHESLPPLWLFSACWP